MCSLLFSRGAQGIPVDDLEARLREVLISEFGATPKAAAA